MRIYDTTTNTLLYDLPLEFRHFDDYSNGSLNVFKNREEKSTYLSNTTNAAAYASAPDNNSVVGTGLGDYWCWTNSWAIDPGNCLYADLRGRALNTPVYSNMQSDDGTRLTEMYYLYVEEALKEANITFDPGYTKYKWEIETKWVVNPEFPHNNVADMLERGGVLRAGNNISPAPSGTYMGTCGGTKQAVSTAVTKEIEVANARKTYSSACGLTICNEVEFNSPSADYFPAEVRIPFKLDSFVVDMPVEYHLTAAPTFGGAAMGAANSIEANGPTIGGGLSGHLVFTNNTANSGTDYADFPRISDADGNQVAWQVCYPVSNVGSDNFVTESYKIPVTYYARDEFDNVIVLVDTFSITEAIPAITVAPLGSTVKIDDGGSCKDSYMDLLVSNNTTYAADNVIVAVNSTTNSTVTNIQLLNLSGSATQLTDTNWYGMSNLYAELGGMAAGDRKTIRVYFNTTMCEDSLKIITNFGCNYPVNQEPDYTSPDLDSAFISFNSVDGGILSGPKDGNKEITDLCTIQTLEVEVRNVRNPNLTNILAAIKLPPNAVYVANSAEIAYPENIYENATVVTLTGTYSLTIDISADPELANACGLPGADESSFPASLNNANDANVFLFKFDVDFSACPTATVDEVTYNVTAENYCGTETSTNGIFNFIYVGTTGTPNTFSCTSVSAEPLPICADSGMTNTITDDLWIKNETGPATSTGNIVKITLANDTAAYDLSNFSVAAPWSAPIITTSASNRTVLEFVVPAGIPADDSVMLSLTYDITPKVSDLCNQLNSNCADVAYSVSFFSQVDVSCPAKSLNCPSLGQESRGSSYVPRDLKCCPQGLGDYVWLDKNQDGIQNANEVGVAGVNVDLYNNGPDGLPNTADDELVGSTVTDAYGHYYFNDLPIGSYNLGFTPPANYTFTNPVAAGDNSFPTNSEVDNTQGSPNYGRTGTYVLTTTEQDSTIDVGLILPPPPVKASVGNYVWFDADQDGIQDPSESGIAGVVVELLDASGNVVATTTTDGNGMYLFDNVDPGDYSVQFSEPIGMVPTANNGAIGGATNSDADSTTLTSPTFTVMAGDSITYVDAGFHLQDPNNASLGDKVFYDTNNDGIQDPGEAGVPNVTVYLYAGDGTTVLDSAVTDALGNYLFNNLPAGDYVVGFEPSSLPSGFAFSPQGVGANDALNSDANPATGKTNVITLMAGDKNMTVDAGNDNPSLTNSIGDYVWNDVNKDGIQDANEPAVAGVTVTLYDAAGMPIATTITDADGYYLFPELPNGTFSIGFSNLPPGYGFTAQDATADNADPATGKTVSVTLTGNTNITDLDAGIYQTGSSSGTASLGDKIWVDLNNDNRITHIIHQEHK